VQYTHTVRNTGDVADGYGLTAVSDSGWTVTVNPAQLNLNPDQTGQVIVTVQIPAGALPGQVDQTTVTARSTTNPAISDSVVDTTTVEGVPPQTAVSIVPDHSGYGTPGSNFSYVHTVSNNGQEADSYTLSLASSQNWGQSVFPTTLSLAAGQSGQVTVQVSIPVGSAPGATDVTLVTVRSQSDATISATATDTTSYPGLYLPIIVKSAAAPPPTPTPTPSPAPVTPTPSPTPRVCGAPTGVDLVVTSIQIVPGAPVSGQPAMVYVTIRNQGTVDVAYGNNFWLDFYVNRLPAPNTRGEIEWGVQGVLLRAGHSETFSAPYIFSGGTYVVWAQVDTDDTVDECPHEDNNVLGLTLNVTGASGGQAAPPPLPDGPRHTPTPAGLPFVIPPTPTPTSTSTPLADRP
jgi:hypothetical protein